ncbi:phosphoribosylamine--glycine ligase [archaeon BMS3Abin17]|nr:phosphoribosylamine--glycine ligase [archaeon BMS3Abin17]
MQRNKIPSPKFKYFNSEKLAKDYIKLLYDKEPEKLIYIKATKLCGGKGALKSKSLDESIRNIGKMKVFGEAGKIFLVEEGLEGEEFSYYAISDGSNYRIFKSAQDNKTISNFDKGDQTGRMGAISPAIITNHLSKEIENQLIAKAINGMKKEHIPYIGILYLGGVVVNDKPINIEYNARWGDPECQVVLPTIKTDYVEIVTSCLKGKLNEIEIEQDNKSRVCVVGASRGYPNDYSHAKRKQIHGLENAMKINGVTIFGADITIQDEKFYTDGGRLFSVVAEGENIVEAKQKAYSAIAGINVEGNNLQYRTDIGWRDIERFLRNKKHL